MELFELLVINYLPRSSVEPYGYHINPPGYCQAAYS